MADQWNANIPELANQISADIPDIKENLEFAKDIFENFINAWSNTDATAIYPAYWNRTALINTDSPYTMLAADIIMEVDASSGAVEIDLVAAASYAKRYVIIKCTDSTNNVTIDPNGAETIDGASSKILYEDDQCIMIYSDGTNWQTLFFYGAGTLVENDTYIKAVNNAGDGTVDLVKANTSDELIFGAQAASILAEQAAAPTTAANQGGVYTKAKDGQSELYYVEESDGDEIQISDKGRLLYPKGYIWGLNCTAGVDTDHDVSIAAGVCTDSTGVSNLELTSSMIKRLDAAWASGSANGGRFFTTAVGDTHSGTMVLDSIPDTSHIKVGMTVAGTGVGAAALVVSIDSGVQITLDTNSTADGSDITFTFGIAPSAWYHFFLIRNDTTGAIDAGWDTSLTCANIPSGYTEYRRIRSHQTDASFNLVQSIQWGDYFRWATSIASVSEDRTSTYTTYVARTVDVPLGVRCIWEGKALANLTGVAYTLAPFNMQPVGASETTPTAVTINLPFLGYDTAQGETVTMHWNVMTDTSSQIEYAFYAASGTYNVRISTIGYLDYRGKFD